MAAPSGHLSATGTEFKGASQSPDLSSTGPAPSPPDMSGAPASSGPENAQSGAEPPVKTSPPGSTGRITDRWTEPTLIGVKATSSSANKPGACAKPAGTAGMVGRRALPGLVNPAVIVDEKPVSKDKERVGVPPSPTRHARIPSTGNRALVMEVAQALSDAAQQQEKEKEEKEKENTSVSAPAPAPTFMPARQAPSTGLGGPATEKRKSSYERYSAIAMPPLVEERTPAATPAHTLSRNAGQNVVLGGQVVGESPLGSIRTESAPPPPSESSKVHIGEGLALWCCVSS